MLQKTARPKYQENPFFFTKKHLAKCLQNEPTKEEVLSAMS